MKYKLKLGVLGALCAAMIFTGACGGKKDKPKEEKKEETVTPAEETVKQLNNDTQPLATPTPPSN